MKLKNIIWIFGLFLIICSTNTIALVSFYNNISAGYHFTSNANDVLGISNAVVSGSISNTTDRSGTNGKAYRFTGGNIALPANNTRFNTSKPYTVTLWIKQTAAEANVAIWSKASSTYGDVTVDLSNNFATRTSYARAITSAPLNDPTMLYQNEWTFIALVYNGSSVCMFTNLTKTCTSTGISAANSAAAVRIGITGYGIPLTTTNIDEFVFVKKGLSDTEISEMYNAYDTWDAAVAPTISFNSTTPVNATYTFNNTPNFVGDITSISGTWNISLIINDTSYGIISDNSTGPFNMTTSTMASNKEYTWWFNATDITNVNNNYITEKRNIYIVGACAATNTRSCSFTAGSIALGAIISCN